MKLALLLSLLLGTPTYVFAQYPPQWDTARTQLTIKLNQIENDILERWDGQPYCTDFTGNLMLANSNRGYALFTPDTSHPTPVPGYQNALYAKIDTMLMAFDTLGYTGVDVTILYPTLVSSFPNSAYYLDFYKNVCRRIKERGFKLIIGCQATFVDSVFGEPKLTGDVRRHYFDPDENPSTDDALELVRFKQEKLQMMQTMIDSLRPDYLTMEMEPQTQEANLFHLIDYSVDNTIALIKYFTSNLQAGSTMLGAGAGTWDSFTYFQQIATNTAVDYIDYHIYPPHFGFISNVAFRLDSIADANNKKLVIGESWCYKATNYEVGSITAPIGTSQLVYSRDVFDYWTPVDTLFVRALVDLSQQSKVELLQFHWPNVMFGQLKYDHATHGTMPPQQILNLGAQIGYTNMFKFNLSPVGLYTRQKIAGICEATSVREAPPTQMLHVYPNPATNIVHIDTPTTDGTVTIADLLGKTVFTGSTADPIIVAGLASGTYIVRRESGHSAQSCLLIIKN